jgi:hypothetical protein
MNDFSSPGELRIRGRATFGINTPVTAPSSVRGAHVDSWHKLFVGLFYLRRPDDESTGGDLILYRRKPGRRRDRWAASIDFDDVEAVVTVPYEPNSYVLFLNTEDAIHGVSPRSVSSVPRYLVVTSGWFASAPEEIFS